MYVHKLYFLFLVGGRREGNNLEQNFLLLWNRSCLDIWTSHTKNPAILSGCWRGPSWAFQSAFLDLRVSHFHIIYSLILSHCWSLDLPWVWNRLVFLMTLDPTSFHTGITMFYGLTQKMTFSSLNLLPRCLNFV